jgi:hypothetical protein
MLKMFFVKGFAAGLSAGRYFGFAAIAITDTATAVRIAAATHAENSAELPTSATEELRKESLTKEIGKEPIDDDSYQFALWIKVPRAKFPL